MGADIPLVLVAEMAFFVVSLLAYFLAIAFADKKKREAELEAKRIRQNREWEEQLQQYPFLRALSQRHILGPPDYVIPFRMASEKKRERINWSREGF